MNWCEIEVVTLTLCCYQRTGPRLKCSSCRIVAHISCVPHMKFLCRPTFWDGTDLRQYRENTDTTHHWVHRRSQTGKCQNCYKSFQSKLSFGSKEIVAITCSWCKAAYHNKDLCFNMDRLKEPCSLGNYSLQTFLLSNIQLCT